MVKLIERVACLRVRTVGLVIGWLGVVGSILSAIITICILGNSDKFADYLQKTYRLSADSHDEIRAVIVLYGSIYLGAVIINGLISGLLVFGIKKNRHLMILPWLIANAIGMVLNILAFIQAVSAMFKGVPGGTFTFFFDIFCLALYVYIYWGIYSLYKHIQLNKFNGHAM
ncbi:hypothetical protein KR093_007957 [Drosophila rubida]|uniref:Uncharacterized protein n=1 Tax=Drosophila rubida TaxID=30044 RepID=A0AAD4K339_9MUSC|nr:hypothetical protein KR093_007957 [Drosophila rubida]